jgi:two-component system, OmpR family, sensor histidine kinase KdpD
MAGGQRTESTITEDGRGRPGEPFMAVPSHAVADRNVHGVVLEHCAGGAAAWPFAEPNGTPSAAPGLYEPLHLSAVAHELRATLSALATSSELLFEDLEALDRHQIRGMVSTIHRGALWLQGLVENMLCAASIEEGRFRVHPRPISLLDVVAEAHSLVRPLLERNNQRLRVSARGRLPHVRADGRRVGQVLVNLISNAVKYTGHGAVLDVTVTARSDEVCIAVADRGRGLPDGDGDRLFEPYYRTDWANESGKEGLGLGLAIVKSIVEAHGGRVGAGNRRGGGARFWFTLPMAAEGASPR